MRTKVVLLIAIAAVSGVLIGLAAARSGGMVWVILAGLAVLSAALTLLGQAWVIAPYDRLAHWLDVQARSAAPFALRNLPVHRRDEIGRIARAIHCISSAAIRNHHDAQQIRRTLDARVKAATRRACSHLELQAMRDHLTGLGNRRALTKNLEPLVEATAAAGDELICLMADMDDFKAVNDTLGHAVGDEMLELLATLLQSGTRGDDLAIRLGGDEFVVLMPGATLRRAADFADQTRAHFRRQSRTVLGDSGLSPDLSIGIASMHVDACHTGAELMSKADEYLYTAKNAGKGRTVCALPDDDRRAPAA